jgi:RimJ/RimL family protein N-acetyltransferase
MQSNHEAGELSTYAFPDELRVDELLVRPPSESDVDEIAPAFLDPAVGGEASLPPVDAERLRTMMREDLGALRTTGQMAPYVIVDSSDGRILGGCALQRFDPMRATVEVGYWLFAAARGRGVATRVVRALVEHAFANGIYRVDAHVRVGNVASERVLERVGFVHEGVKRRYLHYGGGRADAKSFARLADDA